MIDGGGWNGCLYTIVRYRVSVRLVTFIFKVKRNVEEVYSLIADLVRNLEIILAEEFAYRSFLALSITRPLFPLIKAKPSTL